MKMLLKISMIIGLVLAGQVFAADLSSAKSKGLIGERFDGYIGIVKDAPAEVKALVKDVNAKRKARYQEIAKSKKIPLSEVTKIGGLKAIEKTKSGNYIKRAGEGWTKKG